MNGNTDPTLDQKRHVADPAGDRLRIPEFRRWDDPPGTLRWIRWIDDPRPGDGYHQSPKLRVYLDALPRHVRPETIPDLDLRRTLEWSKTGSPDAPPQPGVIARIDAALLPKLQALQVFEDGVAAGSLDLEPKTFTFDGRHTRVELRRADHPGVPELTPKDWPEKWKTLPAARYDRGALFSKAWVVALTDRRTGLTLLIPAFEIFARMVAPSSHLVNVLLGGDWRDSKHKVVNETHCRKREGGSDLVLRNKVSDNLRHLVYLLMYDAHGHRAAMSPYAEYQKLGGGKPISAPNVFVPFKTSLPFALPNNYEIEVRGFRPYNDVPELFVGLRIVRSSWPHPNLDIAARRELDGKTGDVVTVSTNPPPFPKRTMVEPEDRNHAVDADAEAPTTGLYRQTFAATAMQWIDAPPTRELLKVESTTYTGVRPTAVAPDTSGAVGFGETEGRGGSIPAKSEPLDAYGAIDRFEHVVMMFKALREANQLTRLGTVRPPPDRRATVDGLPWLCWQYPLRIGDKNRWCAWSTLKANAPRHPFVMPDDDRARTQLRPALVAWMERDGRTLISVTTMQRPKGDRPYASLVTAADEALGSQVQVAALLEIGAAQSGVWRNADDPSWGLLCPGERWLHYMVTSDEKRVLSPVSFELAADRLR